MYEDFAKWSFDAAKLRNRVLFICNCAYFGTVKGKKEELAKIPEYVDLISEKGYIDQYKLINRMAKLNELSYRAILKTQAAQQVIKETYTEFKSFARALHAKKLRGDKTHINAPRYKDKKNGRYTVTFTNQSIQIENGIIFYELGMGTKRTQLRKKPFPKRAKYFKKITLCHNPLSFSDMLFELCLS